MKKILLLLLFFFFSVTLYAQHSYNIRLTNFQRSTKYVMIKYMNNKGKYVSREVILKKDQDYRVTIHNRTFYLFSVYYVGGGKVRYSIRGKDGVGFMYKTSKGRPAYFQKIDCDMQLRGYFKTVHLGV